MRETCIINYKRIFIYVEGIFDEAVLTNIINTNSSEYHVIIKGVGDKSSVLNKRLILQKYYELKKRNDIYFFLPDLHPYDKPFPHNNVNDIRTHIRDFLAQKDSNFNEENYPEKMRFFVFKFNLEVLFLAEIDKIFEFIETKKGISLTHSFKNRYIEKFNEQYPEETTYNGVNHEKKILKSLLEEKGLNYDLVTANDISKNFKIEILKEKLPHFKDFIEAYDQFI